MIGPVSVKAFSALIGFLTLLILPILLEKHSLLLDELVSMSMFFFTAGEPPLDCGLLILFVYLL